VKETSKATRRRWCEESQGGFPWKSVFVGKGIDVGCGDDPLPFGNCQPFDQKDGDANRLSRYFPAGHFDYLHASQCLEHMHDPTTALAEWLKVVKPGGHVICTVPDWVAYEGMRWPSANNPDHKSSWSMIYRGSIAPIHIHIPTYLSKFPVEVLLARFVDANYDYRIGTSRDQTREESAGVECWNEFVIRKEPCNR